MRSLITLCVLILAAQTALAQPKQAPQKYVLILNDRSESIKKLQDTTQPFCCHLLKLAELSGEPIAFAMIFFGGEGIQVFPKNGQPTTAHRALHHDLLKHWPGPSGGTPLDEALQEAVRIIGQLPRGSDVTLILISDAVPESGRLRPEAFAEVKAEIERLRKAIQGNPKGFPPGIVQQLLTQLERDIEDTETEVFKKLYQIELKAEAKRTLEHAGALKQAKVRTICVDYESGCPELQQFHNAAGGHPNDLIITKPAAVIPRLHKAGITALPQVIVQDPIQQAADPKMYERRMPIKLDPLGDRALITVMFEPPVADFGKHLLLEAEHDGNKVTFTATNEEPGHILSFDSTGQVATAHLLLDRLPDNREVVLSLKSPALSMSMPACQVYVHLRVAKGVVPQFRPHHAPADARGPFRISPKQDTRWTAAYLRAENPKPYPAKSIEAALRNIHNGKEINLVTQADPQVVATFVTDALRLPRGSYDVTLHTILESGAQITTLLPRHIEVQEADEFIAIEIRPKVGEKVEHYSLQPGHVALPEVGDERTEWKVAVTVRSMGVPYDIPVEISIEGLVDCQGKSPKDPWILPDRKKILLKPGRAESLYVSLKVPKKIEEELSDGLFQGTLSFKRTDIDEPLPVKRFLPLAGAEEPADQVTFTLRRPTLVLQAPRCFRDSLLMAKSGAMTLPIQMVVWKPFARTVTLTVAHTSLLTREVTVTVRATFVNSEGKQIPFVRLMVEESKQAIASGGSATWNLRFEADEGYDLRKATGSVLISGDGLPTTQITVEILPRDPLLGPTWQVILWSAAALLALLLGYALVYYLRSRRIREDQPIVITADKGLPGFFKLKLTGRNQVTLLPEQPIWWHFAEEPKRKLGAHSPLSIKPEAISLARPLQVAEQTSDDAEGWSMTFTEVLLDPAEMHGEIVAAPAHAAQTAHYLRLIWKRLFLCVTLSVLAFYFFTPAIVRGAQWLYDFVTL